MEAGSMISNFLRGFISTNIAFSLFTQMSLQGVWLLVNCLQLVIHLGLLQVAMPLNAYLFIKELADVSKLNLIPQEYQELMI